jgi:hypothetical protein
MVAVKVEGLRVERESEKSPLSGDFSYGSGAKL